MKRCKCFAFKGKMLDEYPDLVPDEGLGKDDREKGIETFRQHDNTTVEMAMGAVNVRNTMKALDMPETLIIVKLDEPAIPSQKGVAHIAAVLDN